jgi:hypothetical protein
MYIFNWICVDLEQNAALLTDRLKSNKTKRPFLPVRTCTSIAPSGVVSLSQFAVRLYYCLPKDFGARALVTFDPELLKLEKLLRALSIKEAAHSQVGRAKQN